MVLTEQEPGPPVAGTPDPGELGLEERPLEELLPDPERHCHLKGAQAPRGEGEVGLEQSLELQEGLVVEDDVIDVPEPHPFLSETVPDRLSREARVVLLSGEALFLRRRDDLAVAHQSRRAVVVEGRDTQEAHRRTEALRTACR